MHFCQLHALVSHQQSSTMSKQQESNNDLNYELKNAIQQLPRDVQIKIFKHFYYRSLDLLVFTDQTNSQQISLRHAYTNIDYVKEQIKICTGIPKENQSYFFGCTVIYPDKNFIDYNISWNKVLENIHSWSQQAVIWRFGKHAWNCEFERCQHSIILPPTVKKAKRNPDKSSNLTQQIQSHQQKCVENTLQTDSMEGQTD